MVQSLRLPAHAQVGSPPPGVCDGFMTGQGSADSTDPDTTATYVLRKLACDESSPPDLRVFWSFGGTDYVFVLTSYTATCSDDPGVDPGGSGNFDTITGSGSGDLTVDGLVETGTVEFQFVDEGEPGVNNDRTTLLIRDASNAVVLNIVDETIETGNLQAHGNVAIGTAC